MDKNFQVDVNRGKFEVHMFGTIYVLTYMQIWTLVMNSLSALKGGPNG
jgi:hypothetical protein